MKGSVPLFWVAGKIRRRIPVIVLTSLAAMAVSVFGVSMALGMRQVIDAAIAGNSADFVRACLVQGGLTLGIIVSSALQHHMLEWLNIQLDRDWKRSLLHGLLAGDYAAVSKYHSAELINRLNNDVRILDDGILHLIPNLVSMATKLIAAFLVLYALEPVFSLLLMAAGITVICVTTLMRRKLKGLHKRVSEEDGKVSGFLQETLEKLLMVHAMDVAQEMERRSDALMEERFQVQRKRKNVSVFANCAVNFMSYCSIFITLMWCAAGLLQGKMSFGTLTAMTQLVNQLQNPFVNLSGLIPKYIAMTAAAERLMELDALNQVPVPEAKDAGNLYKAMTGLGASELTFAYDRDTVLEDVSFVLPKGCFAVITGHSGIGKSTLLKLLLGIFQLDAGRLYLQSNQEQLTLDRSTRRLFAYVPQGNLLLSGTLRDNLLVARPRATEEEIVEALYVSDMADFLPQLPRGLDTVLGESGAGLSEGQAQRLAIARAVLGGAPILLLDEATSALDEATERRVLERICSMKDRTCIAVTHRPAALELADWKLEVQNKKITAIPLDV